MPSGGLCILAWRTYSKWFPQGSCQGQHLHSCVDFNPSVSPKKSAAFCFTSHETGFRKMATLLAWQPNKSRMSDVSEAKQKPRLHITLNPMTFAHSASSGISDQVMSWKRVYASISAAKKPPVQGCWGMSMGTELSVGCSWCNLCPGVTSLKGFRDLRGIGLVQGCSSVLRSKKSRLITYWSKAAINRSESIFAKQSRHVTSATPQAKRRHWGSNCAEAEAQWNSDALQVSVGRPFIYVLRLAATKPYKTSISTQLLQPRDIEVDHPAKTSGSEVLAPMKTHIMFDYGCI